MVQAFKDSLMNNHFLIINLNVNFQGDITPDRWPSKLFMGIMIMVALVVIPTQVMHTLVCEEFGINLFEFLAFLFQLEQLLSLWFERQNLGASYSKKTSSRSLLLLILYITMN
jgi:hypothetical protein